MGLLLVGIALCFTIVGIIPGVILMALGVMLAGKQQKVWRCRGCRSVVLRG